MRLCEETASISWAAPSPLLSSTVQCHTRQNVSHQGLESITRRYSGMGYVLPILRLPYQGLSSCLSVVQVAKSWTSMQTGSPVDRTMTEILGPRERLTETSRTAHLQFRYSA